MDRSLVGATQVNLTPTDDELSAARAAGLPTDVPYLYRNVLNTQLSIARHYGVAMISGCTYIYDADADTLVRDDVREWIRSDVAGGACWPVDRFTRAELLARIDAELEGEK